MFKECGLIEKYGSGIARIRKLCKEHRLKTPKFEEIQKGFKVTVYKEVLNQETNDGVGGGVSGGVNDLLDVISKHPGLKTKELSSQIDIPLRTIERWLKHLKDEDKVEFKGPPKTGGYYVT